MSRCSMSRRRSFGRRAGAAALAAALAMVTGLSVSTPAHAADPTEADVYETLEVGDVPIHFEILMDSSAAMFKGGRFARQRSSVLAMIGGMGPNDSVSITTFADTPGDCYGGSVVNPQDMVTCMPAVDEGVNSNLARPLLTAFTDMREEKKPVSVLIVMSDIDRKPAGQSDRKDPLWKALKPASNVPGLRVFGATNGGISSVAALRSVFGSKVGTVNITKAAQAKTIFNKLRTDLQASKLKSLLTPDLTAPVTLAWDHPLDHVDPSTGGASQMLTLQSKAANLPIVLTDVTLVRTEGDESITVAKLPDRIELAPGTPAYYYVQFNWPEKSWFRLSSEHMAVHATFNLHATISSPWDAVLAKHKLKRATALKGPQTLAVSGETDLKPPFLQLALIVVGALTVLVLLIVVIRKLSDWRGAHRRA